MGRVFPAGVARSRIDLAHSARTQQADLVVLNTCHIREQASEKIYSELGRLRDAKNQRRAEGRAQFCLRNGCIRLAVDQTTGGNVDASRDVALSSA